MPPVTPLGASKIKGRRVFFIIALILALVVSGGIFFTLSKYSETTTYHVLNQPVEPRTQITAEMLQEIVAAKGSAPGNAFTPDMLVEGDVYSRYALNAGDIVTQSNAGPITPINEGIPSNYVVASFTADAETSVAGRIKRGDYIDIIATNADESAVSKYALRNVYVLEVNSDLAEAQAVNAEVEETPGEGATESDTTGARSGVPSVYTVGLSQEDALTLAAILEDQLFIVLSPAQYREDGAGEYDTTVNRSDIFAQEWITGDSGVGTGVLLPEEETPAEGTVEGENTPTEDTPTETGGDNTDTPTETETGVTGVEETVEDTATP